MCSKFEIEKILSSLSRQLSIMESVFLFKANGKQLLPSDELL